MKLFCPIAGPGDVDPFALAKAAAGAGAAAPRTATVTDATVVLLDGE